MPTTDQLEYVRAAPGVALVLANIAVWYGVYLERDSPPKETQDRGWRILVRSLAMEAALAFFLFAVDTTIGLRQTAALASAGVEIANANKRANEAVAEAGRLGVSQKGLHDFVTGKQNEIDQQFGQFKTFTAEQQRRTAATITQLNSDRERLEKARDDALAAAKTAESAKAHLTTLDAKVTRVTTRRSLTLEARVSIWIGEVP